MTTADVASIARWLASDGQPWHWPTFLEQVEQSARASWALAAEQEYPEDRVRFRKLAERMSALAHDIRDYLGANAPVRDRLLADEGGGSPASTPLPAESPIG